LLVLWSIPRLFQPGPFSGCHFDLREATDLQIAFLQSPDSLKDLVAFLELSRVDKGTEFLEIAHQAATLTAADHPFLPPPRPTPRQQMWRMLHESAIKPWQHEHWLFPKNPRFAEKAGPILDLYAGMWEGESLGRTTYVLSMDEKTSIQVSCFSRNGTNGLLE
jgi:hypothetical protein